MVKSFFNEATACDVVKDSSDIQTVRNNRFLSSNSIEGSEILTLENIVDKYDIQGCKSEFTVEEIEIINEFMVERIAEYIESWYNDYNPQELQDSIDCNDYCDMLEITILSACEDGEIPQKYWNCYYEGECGVYDYLDTITQELIRDKMEEVA